MIGGRRPLQGRKPADRRVRVERPHSLYFRYSGPGQLTAKEAASAPRTPLGRGLARVRGVLFGRPLSMREEIGERLNVFTGLPIFASDNISSSAYATEEIMRVLVLAGAGALVLTLPITVVIVVVLAIVVTSYRQTIAAYPNGGGSYIVASDNLGSLPGLTAAAALLTDYVLTVAVSVAAGVAALTSIVPALFEHPRRARRGDRRRHRAHQPARHPRERARLQRPDVRLPGLDLRRPRATASSATSRDHARRTRLRPPGSSAEAAEPLGLLLILRAFSSGVGRPDRHRGRL